LLLLTKNEWVKSSVVAVADVEPGKEAFNVMEIKGRSYFLFFRPVVANFPNNLRAASIYTRLASSRVS
jgi:hypothetical protein